MKQSKTNALVRPALEFFAAIPIIYMGRNEVMDDTRLDEFEINLGGGQR